jgi:hypothetical protein
MKKIYETVDVTDDECYYPMNLSETLENAIGIVTLGEHTKGFKPATGGCEDGEVIEIEIRERTIGEHGVGKRVWGVTWIEFYNEERDELEWVRVKP